VSALERIELTTTLLSRCPGGGGHRPPGDGLAKGGGAGGDESRK